MKARNSVRKLKISKEKLRDVLIVSVVALLLVFALWRIFYDPNGSDDTQASGVATAREKSVAALLSEMEGVGTAEVRIYEESDGVKSVVVVCDGAKSILVNSNVKEAVAAALGVDGKNVKVYQRSG